MRDKLISLLQFIPLLMLTQVLPILAWLLGNLGRSMAAQIVAALLFTVAAVAMCGLYLQLYLKQADGYSIIGKPVFRQKNCCGRRAILR